MKYKPSRDIPRFVRKYRSFSPSELRQIVLSERNKSVTPESITNWFRRNPKVTNSLKEEIIEKELPKEEVQQTIFKNGAFEELRTIKNWILEMNDRELSPEVISGHITAIKRICQGRFKKKGIDLVKDGLWSYKHPDRLTIQDVINLCRFLRKRGVDTHTVRLASRNFLESKGFAVGKKISGAKSKGFGKLADLYVDINKLKAILETVRISNYQAYVIDLFMFKTGTRINATLDLKIQEIKWEDQIATVTDKGRHSMGRKKWKKHIDQELGEHLKKIIGDRTTGKVFNLIDQEMSEYNKESFKIHIPELVKRIRMPNHFWRHMFAQHMLRLTKWNYPAVANLGGWTIKSLEESYGKPPKAVVREWGLEYLPLLKVSA